MAASKEALQIGERIRELRDAAGYSQGLLAELCGWRNSDGEPAQNRVSNYERGIRKLNYIDAGMIAKALGVGPEAILFGRAAEENHRPTSREHVVFGAFRKLPEGLRSTIGDLILQTAELRPPRSSHASSAPVRRRRK